MHQRKNKSIAAAVVFTALVSALAAGCYYYDQDDDWGYYRYPERRYSYRYDRTAIGATVAITTGAMIGTMIVGIAGTTRDRLAIATIATVIKHA